ncbi:MAG: hypothetical protein JWQ97_48 [Phenylobacterium sp.]|nr:hypothetical protein [Phenylobacterium sp.]
MALSLVQFRDGDGRRGVAAVLHGETRRVQDVESTLTLAQRALAAGRSLLEEITVAGLGAPPIQVEVKVL